MSNIQSNKPTTESAKELEAKLAEMNKERSKLDNIWSQGPEGPEGPQGPQGPQPSTQKFE